MSSRPERSLAGAAPGRGESGGARVLVAARRAGRWFFLYGFAKNERATIRDDELKALQEIASELLALDERQLAVALAADALVEICDDDDEP